MKYWIGKSIVLIGVLHTLVGIFGYSVTIGELVDEKFFDAVGGHPDRELMFWFVAFGLLAIVHGIFVDAYERCATRFPRRLGWTLFIFAALVVIVIPVSGAWLFFIPAAGAIHHAGRRG